MTDHPLIYNKLVRDLIPEQITSSGKYASIGTLNTEQFLQALRLKLLEEAHELFHADTRADIINESADLLELMETLLKHQQIDFEEVLRRKQEKQASAGGFDKKLILYATSNQTNQLSTLNNQVKEPRLPQRLTFNSLTGLVDIIKRELEDATTLSIASA